MDLISRLVNLGDVEKISDNNLANYLPIRSKNNVINYDTVAGNVLGLLMGKQLNIKRNKLDEFRHEFKLKCLDKVSSRLTDESMLAHIENMYFYKDALLKASPEFLLFGRQEKETNASRHLSQIFCNFLVRDDYRCELRSKANFVEKIFVDVLQDYLQPTLNSGIYKERFVSPYLPFIADVFSKDIQLIIGKTDYFLNHFESFLELYSFLYCSQMALNVLNWTLGKPKSQPLYFILDKEKASLERSKIHTYGYSSLHSSFGKVFPVLSMLENINKTDPGGCVEPLWQYGIALQAENYDKDKVAKAIAIYADRFCEKRRIQPIHEQSNTPEMQLKRLIRYALDQFEPSKYLASATRHEIRNAYQNEFEKQIARHFVKSRGRAGRVLVMNQDYLLLLTNLAIGCEKQLRFQELLREFKSRGVYFDKQSEQALIAFYERVGNVDRMSDSGDSIYVRSTI